MYAWHSDHQALSVYKTAGPKQYQQRSSIAGGCRVRAALLWGLIACHNSIFHESDQECSGRWPLVALVKGRHQTNYDGIIYLWKAELLKPKPFSPVQSARKFSAVLGTWSAAELQNCVFLQYCSSLVADCNDFLSQDRVELALMIQAYGLL